MTYDIEIKILTKIKKAKRGSVFFTDDFVVYGTAKACNKVLERLTERGEIMRVSRGIYTLPRRSKLLDIKLTPSIETVAKAIARRDRARIVPTGAFALNALGLSTQVPMNAVYLSDGANRRISIGKQKLLFKKTSPRNLAAIGAISSLAIQALKAIGKDNATEDEIEKIIQVLKKEKPERLDHDLKLAPEWIRIIMRKAQNYNN